MTKYDDPIREYQAKLLKKKDMAENLRPLVKACNEAILRSEIGEMTNLTVDDRFSGQPVVIIMLVCKNLKESIPLFKELAKEGLRTDKEKSPEDRNVLGVFAVREYIFNEHLKMLVTIVQDNNESVPGTCRLVQTGTKEVPIYEMKCDE